MKRSEFWEQLRQEVSPAEWEALEQNAPLPVSPFNREVLLEMWAASAAPDGEVSEERAVGLREALRAYLAEHMADQSAGWKYVILANLYLTFLAGRPIHPVDQLGIKVSETENGTVYECPQKSTLQNTACDYCVCKRMSNYEITKRQMARAFAQYDHEAMIRRFRLTGDAEFLYVRFLSRLYRLDRHSGAVVWSEDGFATSVEADFREAMTLYDVLCNAREDGVPAGEFVNISHLVNAASKPETSGKLTARQTRLFDHREAELSWACEQLGGTKYGKGDVAYRLPLFDFLPVALQFWNSDDEFPASLHLLWDKNIIQFMHFETVWYAAGHLLDRLQELVESLDRP